LGAGAHFVIPVARWAAWPPAQGAASGLPDVRFIDASLRRRLGPLARAMLHVAHECAAEGTPTRLVFASRHGELGYTVTLLRALAAAEPLSPTLFSLSVHNASAGLFSTFRHDRAASTAIAAGAETLGQALLEAYCQLASDAGSLVLIVYGDEALPDEYREFGEAREAHPRVRALAVLLSAAAPRRSAVTTEAAADAASSEEAQAESFVHHLAQGAPGAWVGGGRRWRWH
jgi:hypothetical protein